MALLEQKKTKLHYLDRTLLRPLYFNAPWRGGEGGSPVHYLLPIWVCASQRGSDFEDPGLERSIHFRGVF